MTLSALYVKELSCLGHGYPVWDPQPTNPDGVQIGDVGLMRDDCFYRLFNVIAPANHPYNRTSVPDGFTPFQYDPVLLDICDPYMLPGIYSGRNVAIRRSTSSSETQSHLGSYTAKLTGDGGLLVLTDSARREVLMPSEALDDYFLRFRSHWLDHATRLYGTNVKVDDLILVRGWVKTSRNWAACSWSLGSDDVPLEIDISAAGVKIKEDPRNGIQTASGCKTSRSASIGLPPYAEPFDQSVFLLELRTSSDRTSPGHTASSVCTRNTEWSKHGIPLWHPDFALPNRHEVQIGDVGYVNDGAFHRLFNVTVDTHHPWNSNGVPPSFAPYLSRLKYYTTTFGAGVYANDAVHTTSSRETGDSSADQCYRISCESQDGSILFLSKAATSTVMLPDVKFQDYVSANQPHWISFSSRRRHGPRKPEDLILVQGFVKASQWSIISAVCRGIDSRMAGSFTSSPDGSSVWRETERRNMSVEHRSSTCDDDTADQCVFLRKYDSHAAHITAPISGDCALESIKAIIHDIEPPSQTADTNQDASKLYTGAEANKTMLEFIHRTEIPPGDTNMRGHISSEANRGSTTCRKSGDLWMEYVLEGLLFPNKRRCNPAVPGRRTEIQDIGDVGPFFGPHCDTPLKPATRESKTLACVADFASSAFDAEVAELLRLTLRHDKPYDHVVKIVRSDTSNGRKLAEVVLEEVQELLDMKYEVLPELSRGTDVTRSTRSSLCRLLLKICKELQSVPRSLFLQGVVCPNKESPVAGGSFADVFRATHKGSPVALKRFRVFGRDFHAEANQTSTAFYQEAIVWRQLKHPHILPLLGLNRDAFGGMICMVSSWMSRGNINERSRELRAGGQPIPSTRWAYEIASGLQYLHSERIIHGDLRGANILVDHNDHVRIADFGLSFLPDMTRSSGGFTAYRSGACRWVAPEVLSSSAPTYAADVYSFGCVCFEICAGKAPYPHLPRDSQVIAAKLGRRAPFEWPSIDTDDLAGAKLRDLAMQCGSYEPELRPEISTVEIELFALLER